MWTQETFRGNHTLMPASISNHIRQQNLFQYVNTINSDQIPLSAGHKALPVLPHDFYMTCLNLQELSCPVSKESSQRTVSIQLNKQERHFPLFSGTNSRPYHQQNG